ncbi:MAG: DUF6036 family nucleotidyltransferase [Tepidisphaeraceae bacterium]
MLPSDWKDRLVALKSPATGGATGLCLEVHDLAVSKLIAGREKDVEYVASLVNRNMIDAEIIRQRLNNTVVDDTRKRLALETASMLFTKRRLSPSSGPSPDDPSPRSC